MYVSLCCLVCLSVCVCMSCRVCLSCLSVWLSVCQSCLVRLSSGSRGPLLGALVSLIWRAGVLAGTHPLLWLTRSTKQVQCAASWGAGLRNHLQLVNPPSGGVHRGPNKWKRGSCSFSRWNTPAKSLISLATPRSLALGMEPRAPSFGQPTRALTSQTKSRSISTRAHSFKRQTSCLGIRLTA
jgi:hypothetical protein